MLDSREGFAELANALLAEFAKRSTIDPEELVSRPGNRAELVSRPENRAELVSRPGNRAELVSRPGNRADAAARLDVSLTPRIALIAALVYLSGADGNLDENEIGDVLRVVPDRATLAAALDYCTQHEVESFLQAAAGLLSSAQKLCLMLNAIDLALGDGMLDAAEQQMLLHYAEALELPEQDLQPHVRTLMYKNDLSVFDIP